MKQSIIEKNENTNKEQKNLKENKYISKNQEIL